MFFSAFLNLVQVHSIFSWGHTGGNLETFQVSSWHSERSKTNCLSVFIKFVAPQKGHLHSKVLCYCIELIGKGRSLYGSSQSSRLCTIKSSCRHLGARMRHCTGGTERPRNIIHALNSSAGILPPDWSFIEIGSGRLSITDYCFISLAKWQECSHSH